MKHEYEYKIMIAQIEAAILYAKKDKQSDSMGLVDILDVILTPYREDKNKVVNNNTPTTRYSDTFKKD